MKKGTIVFRSEWDEPTVCFKGTGDGDVHVSLYQERDEDRPGRFRWMVSDVRACTCDRVAMTLQELIDWPVKKGIWGGGVSCPAQVELSEEVAGMLSEHPDTQGRVYMSHPCKTREGSGSVCLGSCNIHMSFDIVEGTMQVYACSAPCDESCALVPFRPNRRLKRAITAHVRAYGIRPLSPTKAA